MQESCGEGGQHTYELATLEISTHEKEGLVYLQVCLIKRLERSCVKHSQGFPSFSHHRNGKTEAKTHLEIFLKTKLELCDEKESLLQAQDHRQLNFISKSHK